MHFNPHGKKNCMTNQRSPLPWQKGNAAVSGDGFRARFRLAEWKTDLARRSRVPWEVLLCYFPKKWKINCTIMQQCSFQCGGRGVLAREIHPFSMRCKGIGYSTSGNKLLSTWSAWMPVNPRIKERCRHSLHLSWFVASWRDQGKRWRLRTISPGFYTKP